MKGGSSGKKKYIKKYVKPTLEGGSTYGGGSTTDSCKSLRFKTRLQKPTMFLSHVLPDDELSIRNHRGDLQAIDSTGNNCGSIISTHNAQIIECMERGYKYKAVVNAISGTKCDVAVQAS